MGLGFAPVKSPKEKPRTKRPKLTPIGEIQSNLSSYFAEKSVNKQRIKDTS